MLRGCLLRFFNDLSNIANCFPPIGCREAVVVDGGTDGPGIAVGSVLVSVDGDTATVCGAAVGDFLLSLIKQAT